MFDKDDLSHDERKELAAYMSSMHSILEGMYGALDTYRDILDKEMLNKYINAVLTVYTSILKETVDFSSFLNLVGAKREEVVVRLGSVLCSLYGQGFADGRKLMVN